VSAIPTVNVLWHMFMRDRLPGVLYCCKIKSAGRLCFHYGSVVAAHGEYKRVASYSDLIGCDNLFTSCRLRSTSELVSSAGTPAGSVFTTVLSSRHMVSTNVLLPTRISSAATTSSRHAGCGRRPNLLAASARRQALFSLRFCHRGTW
jgi:hypothetical protein